MNDFFIWLSNNPIWAMVFFGVLIIAIITITIMYVIAFYRGQEISFWPPKIGTHVQPNGEFINFSGNSKLLRIHEDGRLQPRQILNFYKDAKFEMIEVGIAMRHLRLSFDHRGDEEVIAPMLDLLKRGVTLKFLLLEPENTITEFVQRDEEIPNLSGEIKETLKAFDKLRRSERFSNYKHKMGLFTYSHFPRCYIMLIDRTEPDGRALISHYLYGIKHANSPYIEIYKKSNPKLFSKYEAMVLNFLQSSQEYSGEI